MNDPAKLSVTGRRAMAARDWNTVGLCGIELKRAAPGDAEGPFFLGVAQKAARQPQLASQYFAEALQLDEKRYDAAIELAFQDVLLNRHAEARELVDEAELGVDHVVLADQDAVVQPAARAQAELVHHLEVAHEAEGAGARDFLQERGGGEINRGEAGVRLEDRMVELDLE